jgi:hypothetical protein
MLKGLEIANVFATAARGLPALLWKRKRFDGLIISWEA